MTFIALDDEPLALALIEHLAREVPEWQLLQTFTDAASAARFLSENIVDLLLIDINMPDVSGLDFVRDLPEEHPMVIFLTAYKEHAHEGFDLDVVDYLVKPVSKDRFRKAFNKAATLLELHQQASVIADLQKEDHFYVYSEYEKIKITIKDILYLESMGDYVKIFLNDRPKPILTLNRLKHFAEILSDHRFRRIHRSYLINLEKVEGLQKSQVRIGKEWLPVGETYAGNLKDIGG